MKQTDIEFGTGEITTTSGNGTATITFDQVFDYAPVVIVTLGEDLGNGKVGMDWVHTITPTTFIYEIDSDIANDTYTFNWCAGEHRASEKAGL